jgi:ribonuclease HII
MPSPPWGHPAWLVGVDECGTGALAGPFYICAFAARIRKWQAPAGLRDSKELTWNQKARLYQELIGRPQHVSFGTYEVLHPAAADREFRHSFFNILSVSPQEVDRVGLRRAWSNGVARVSKAVMDTIYYMARDTGDRDAKAVIDGSVLPSGLGGWAFAMEKADRLVPVVSAASVIAKVNRDMHMIELNKEFPMYDWGSNMGYGARRHMEALHAVGATPHHRRSCAPVQKVLPEDQRRTKDQIFLENTERDILGLK